MRRLRTPEEHIRQVVAQTRQPKVRQAFLLDAYLGYSISIMVQFTDPRQGTRGVTAKARVRPGIRLGTLPSGSPVSVTINHGQVEVIGIAGASGV